MKALKVILIVVGTLIAIPLIVALFVPKKYTVSVSETINKPQQDVYDYVRILANQEAYSEWVKADPNLHPEIVGVDGTVGATQKWNSKDDNVGEGMQTITAMTQNRIDVEITFIRPFEGKALAANIFKAVSENQTEITSEFFSESPWPMNLMSYCFGKKMIEDTQRKNLQNIKGILEKQ